MGGEKGRGKKIFGKKEKTMNGRVQILSQEFWLIQGFLFLQLHGRKAEQARMG
jgi:hypothetical protein